MDDKNLGRLTIRLSSEMMIRLAEYKKQTGAHSDSSAVQFILNSFLNQPNHYPDSNTAELEQYLDRRTSFTLTKSSLRELEREAKNRKASKTECLRLALYYTLF